MLREPCIKLLVHNNNLALPKSKVWEENEDVDNDQLTYETAKLLCQS